MKEVHIPAAALVNLFVSKSKRERTLDRMLQPRKRSKFRASLPHFGDFDPRCKVEIPSTAQTADQISNILRARGATSNCYVASANSELDDRLMPLDDALHAVVGQVPGTIIFCPSGPVGYYEGEHNGERHLLIPRRAR